MPVFNLIIQLKTLKQGEEKSSPTSSPYIKSIFLKILDIEEDTIKRKRK